MTLIKIETSNPALDRQRFDLEKQVHVQNLQRSFSLHRRAL